MSNKIHNKISETIWSDNWMRLMAKMGRSCNSKIVVKVNKIMWSMADQSINRPIHNPILRKTSLKLKDIKYNV